MDKRPDPKPRKNVALWQIYQNWEVVHRVIQRGENRISTIEAGKSVMDANTERAFLADLEVYDVEDELRKALAKAGQSAGPIWDWITQIKGLKSGYLPAKLLALIDYPGAFPGCKDPDSFNQVAKLWRFLGLSVTNGRAEVGTTHYCRKAKALLLGPQGIAEQFVMKQTPVYVEVYYEEKDRLRGLHPESLCRKCGATGYKKGTSSKWNWACPNECKVKGTDGKMISARIDWTPIHIDRMAKRKMVKEFIKHLWVKWRTFEGLPTEPTAT